MPIPSHGPFCKTWVYETSYWHCSNQIAVLQCSCGSAVLFDEVGKPWPKHHCGGRGQHKLGENKKGAWDNGLSGWSAVDQLRSFGMPIKPEVIRTVFGNKTDVSGNKSVNPDIKAIAPSKGANKQLIVHLMEFHRATTSIEQASNLTSLARQIEGLPNFKGKLVQVTVHHSIGNERHSYTALAPNSIMPTRIDKHRQSHSVFHVHLFATQNYWFIKDLHLL